MKLHIRSWAICLWVYSVAAYAIDIRPELSGSWYNPDQSGHGFSIEVVSGSLSVFYWYVYNPDGTPTFLIVVGENNGDTIEGVAYFNTGMVWQQFDPATLSETPWGTISITFHDCLNATLNYQSSHQIPGIPAGMGSIPLVRLLSLANLRCANNPNAGIYEGVAGGNQPGDERFPITIVLAPGGAYIGFADFGELAFGPYAVNGSMIEASGTLLLTTDAGDNWSVDSAEFEGSIAPGHRLMLDYEINGTPAGWADLYALNSLYQRGVSLTQLAGNWSMFNLFDGGLAGLIAIATDGTVSGSDASGCSYAGSISVPDTNFNLFAVTISVSGCANAGGPYSGYGFGGDPPELAQQIQVRLLRIFVANHVGGSAVSLVR